MFYDSYINKSNNELIEILNSNSYQLLARETAQKILDERKVEYRIIDDKPELSELNCFQLFDKLKEYGLVVYTSQRQNLIEIKQDNNGLIIAFVMFVLSFISLIIITINIFEIYYRVSPWSAGSRAYILKGWLIAVISFIIIGIRNYRNDYMSFIKIKFRENSLKITKRKIWEKKSIDLKLSQSNIYYKKTEKKFKFYIPYKNQELFLFELKDNNIGNKTDDLLSIIIDKLNNKIKNCW